MIQIKTFTSEKSCNEWLAKIDEENDANQTDTRIDILKYYSNGPDYFFIVFDVVYKG
jgi:hypothetical protein